VCLRACPLYKAAHLKAKCRVLLLSAVLGVASCCSSTSSPQLQLLYRFQMQMQWGDAVARDRPQGRGPAGVGAKLPGLGLVAVGCGRGILLARLVSYVLCTVHCAAGLRGCARAVAVACAGACAGAGGGGLRVGCPVSASSPSLSASRPDTHSTHKQHHSPTPAIPAPSRPSNYELPACSLQLLASTTHAGGARCSSYSYIRAGRESRSLPFTASKSKSCVAASLLAPR
jgi:hypothetical protein